MSTRVQRLKKFFEVIFWFVRVLNFGGLCINLLLVGRADEIEDGLAACAKQQAAIWAAAAQEDEKDKKEAESAKGKEKKGRSVLLLLFYSLLRCVVCA